MYEFKKDSTFNYASLGMTVQKFICDKYKIPANSYALAQFNSAYDVDLVNGLDELTNNIFEVIGKKPKECVTYVFSSEGKKTLIPHNFILSDGSTLSIRTNKNGDKVAPRVVGQCGIDVFNAHFSEISGREVHNKEEIKEVVFNHIDELLPTFLEYLFLSDYTVWIRVVDEDKYEFTLFDRNQIVNIETERENFSFTRDIEKWTESTTLKYKGISIAEIQIHKNRTFKFRFIMKAIQRFLVEVKNTTETFGMTAEKAICDMFKLEYPDNIKARSSASLQREITPIIEQAFEKLPRPIKHTGSEKGERGGESKCSYDFLLEGNKQLSLKTNTGKMICPPEVGQPGADTCYLYFGHLTEENEITPETFKKMVLHNISEMMPIYLSHLLDSDYLLWIYKRKNDYNYKIFESDFANNANWEKVGFSFTKKTIEEWNESNTLKYNDISIGEFQVHKSRSCYKFRFNMENLEKVLKEEGWNER